MLVPRCHHSHHAAALGSSASGALWPAFSQQVGTGTVAVHSRRMLDGHMEDEIVQWHNSPAVVGFGLIFDGDLTMPSLALFSDWLQSPIGLKKLKYGK